MGFSKPPGVPCPPNNPHCHGAIPDAPIENYLFMAIIVVLITIYTFYIMKPKVKITVSEIEKLNAISKEVNKSWFDQVSTFLFGAKGFKWGELKGL